MKALDYTFEKLGEEDMDSLIELERRCFSFPWNEKQYSLGLSFGFFHVFGLTGPEGLAAYVSFNLIGDEIEILNIAVKPELRRQGLGSRLLRLTLSIAAHMGAKKAFLDVRESNQDARALYRGFGFERIGTRRKYYPDTNEDALTMTLDMSGMWRS